MVGDTIEVKWGLIIMEKQYKKVSFRIDNAVYNDIANEAER